MVVKLKVLKGSSAGAEILVKVLPFVIGRSDECNLKPKTDQVSRRHCEIFVEAGKVMVRDLSSRNGTYVNGERLTNARELAAGDQLKVGPLEFTALIESGSHSAVKAVAKKSAPKSGDSGEIGQWLEEGDAIDKAQRRLEPETRQFHLGADTTTVAAGAQGSVPSSTNTTIVDAAALKAAEKEAEKKKAPDTMPLKPVNDTKNSRDAATVALKKLFFNK